MTVNNEYDMKIDKGCLFLMIIWGFLFALE